MKTQETLIILGDEVKALDDNGKVGGYLIRFSDPLAPRKDLARQWFSAKTYLGPKEGDGAECLFEHGYSLADDIPAKKRTPELIEELDTLAELTFAPIKTSRDTIGIWAETVLDISDDYQKRVFEMSKSGKLGWSSGTAGHRMRWNRKTGEITQWPIVEGSLTPRPCEPLNFGGVLPMKSFHEMLLDAAEILPDPKPVKATTLSARLSQYIEDLIEDGKSQDEVIKSLAREAMMEPSEIEEVLDGKISRPSNSRLKAFARVLGVKFETLRGLAESGHSKTIKGLFDEALENHSYSQWELHNVYCGIIGKLVGAAAASRLTGTEFDLDEKINEATAGYAERLADVARTQADAYLEAGSEDSFYLRSLGVLAEEDFYSATQGLSFEDNAQMLVTGLGQIAARFIANNEARKAEKAGRVLSDKNRKLLASLAESVMEKVSLLQQLLDETQPMATEDETMSARTRLAKMRFAERRHQIGA